jgi:cytochrome c biogenesis protein CcdA
MPEGPFAYYLALGMVATVNPCGFAMLPAYLSYYLGLDDEAARREGAPLSQAFRVALAVSAGFLAVFAVAGSLIELLDAPVYEYAPWISLVIGLALMALGVAMVGGFKLVVRLPQFQSRSGSGSGDGRRPKTVRSMFLFGVSYAVASIGCTLPGFLITVAGTIDNRSVADGVIAFAFYAAGMALVLTTLTVTMALARTSVVQFLRWSQRYIDRVAGGLVAVAGAYVAWYGLLELRTYRSNGGNVPSSSITEGVAGLSADISDWINSVGAVPLAVILGLILGLAALWATYLRTPAPVTQPASAKEEGHESTSDPQPSPQEVLTQEVNVNR